MKKSLKAFGFFVLGALVVGLIFIGGNQFFSKEEESDITSTLLKNQIQSALELTTTKYVYTNAGSFENQKNFYGWDVPFTRSHFIVTYDGTIHSGIDLEEVDVQISGQNIQVTLPEAKVLSHEIDDNSLEVLDENSSTFNKIEVKDFQDFASNQKEKVEQDAIDNGLLEETQEQTKKGIQSILEVNPEIESGEYSLNIK